MFKRSNRAKMLALVASLGTVGSNINSNAGAANANNASSSLSEKILTGVGGFALGATTLALLAKFTGLGSKLVGTGSLKADKAALVKYFKYLVERGDAKELVFEVDNGNVDIEVDNNSGFFLGNLDIEENDAKALEGNQKLSGDALYNAQKRWSELLSYSCMAGLIEARKLADLKHPKQNYEYKVTVTINDENISCDIGGFKINKKNDEMDDEAKQINDFAKKVEDTVKEFTIVQAFKEATLESEKETEKEKK
ncbi:MAG: hypothetical protein IJQ10_03465 [Clostridia bacterium]|nr:hypothetical protein [Clostridia bacterium]